MNLFHIATYKYQVTNTRKCFYFEGGKMKNKNFQYLHNCAHPFIIGNVAAL